jgi:SAM-dependent methyltransferase
MKDQVKKEEVYEFWNRASCGEELYLSGEDYAAYTGQSEARYRLEPYIIDFAKFDSTKGKKVLEIGVGLGADHKCFAQAGAELYGIDLTPRAIEHTRRFIDLSGLKSNLTIGDAESLDFPDNYFDIVYSWGVLHHSPNTPKAISEVHRVLKNGGTARIMIYHKWSMIGIMLWLRYALLTGRPWLSMETIYAKYLESPGTKAYSVAEAKLIFKTFEEVSIQTILTHGDLLESAAGQRHGGVMLSFARKILPRQLIRTFFPTAGLFMLVEAKK